MAGLAVWKANFGDLGEAADGNHDGAVDAADYNTWRNNLGKTLPGVEGTTSSRVVPKPNVAVFVCLGFGPVIWFAVTR